MSDLSFLYFKSELLFVRRTVDLLSEQHIPDKHADRHNNKVYKREEEHDEDRGRAVLVVSRKYDEHKSKCGGASDKVYGEFYHRIQLGVKYAVEY